MELVLIAAIAENGVIGKDGGMPWHLPEDFAHFKKTTMGHPVIMGRVNFEDVLEGLGEPLPGRTNIVLSRSDPDLPDDVVIVESIPEAIEAAKSTGSDRAFVAGGAEIYAQMLPLVDRLILSELPDGHAGDTYFPKWDRSAWRMVDTDERDEFIIVEYVRQ